jgi:hypothetical protein
MASLPQTLEIIFQVQRERINEKITRKKKAFQVIKHDFFLFFFPLWTLATFKPHNFFFIIILNDLICYISAT